MIVGLFLKNYKTYSGINYIPLSGGDQFSGLLGRNGVGKSSILEALDSFFNERPWNVNSSARANDTPYIVPVFLVCKDSIPDSFLECAEEYAKRVSRDGGFLDKNPGPVNARLYNEFRKTESIIRGQDKFDNYLLLPFGFCSSKKISISIFEHAYEDEGEDCLESLSFFLQYLKKTYQYVYVPKELDASVFSRLEQSEIQTLMGETLHDITKRAIPEETIRNVSSSLDDALEEIESALSDYEYRYSESQKKRSLKPADIYSLIIRSYFSIRKLYVKDSRRDIDDLSSGEKQKVIVDIIYGLIRRNPEIGKSMIVAIDEPESSLHISACFSHFNKIHEISKSSRQLIFTSHWYGFLPIIESGGCTFITPADRKHAFKFFDIGRYREEIRQSTGKKDDGEYFPDDVHLKSVSDFVQAILASSASDDPYNWIICEGSSEKIYFEHYFKDLISSKNLRIVPVGGAPEVRKVYRHLIVSVDDIKKSLKGKIFLITDTDENLVTHDTVSSDIVCWKRIVNSADKNKTLLVNISSNPISPSTEIEDVLHGNAFFETLKEMTDGNENFEFLLEESTFKSGVYSAVCLDLRSSQEKIIADFFGSGSVKFEFAKLYCEKLGDDYEDLPWIKEIKDYFN